MQKLHANANEDLWRRGKILNPKILKDFFSLRSSLVLRSFVLWALRISEGGHIKFSDRWWRTLYSELFIVHSSENVYLLTLSCTKFDLHIKLRILLLKWASHINICSKHDRYAYSRLADFEGGLRCCMLMHSLSVRQINETVQEKLMLILTFCS